MKITKYALVFAGLFLIGACKTAQISTAGLNYITAENVLAKKAPLSEMERQRWSHLDIQKDSIPGMSVDKAYTDFLSKLKPSPIIVAVIDSGIDVNHEDLQGRIWTNTKEIPGNGIDDDKNGYIDDVHGWNFLGDINNENMEVTRLMKILKKDDPKYAAIKKAFDKKLSEAKQEKFQVDMINKMLESVDEYFGRKNYGLNDIKNIESTKPMILNSKRALISILETDQMSMTKFREDIKKFTDQTYKKLNYNLNLEFEARSVLNDDPNNWNTIGYGNNQVVGPNVEDADHGTHVSGIMAQLRGNGKGGDGVVKDNIQIMCLRAVPDGDEYDKDIAKAIRYAVDNGAKIINGSFGKGYATHPEWLLEAIQYAAKKDVLIVHAAGNDNEEVKEDNNFPNDTKNGKEVANNFINIGALSYTWDEKLPASFSNYSKTMVDIFSPGNDIYASIPNNKYDFYPGTSMASPNAAGVAALLRSYFPKLTAEQTKKILLESGVSVPIKVNIPGSDKKVSFTELCKTGKIVNAYNAVLMALRK
jgi:subtilisin family serine protease